jgi:excisionase family DNA binding protein
VLFVGAIDQRDAEPGQARSPQREIALWRVRSSPCYAFMYVGRVRSGGVTDQLLTVSEVATQLKITPETVRRWLRTGKIRGALPGGDKMGYRIAEGEVTRLLSTTFEARSGA